MDLEENKFIILIPFRNVKEYINKGLESILNQKYENYSIFLLDDNSNDGTTDSILYSDERINIVKNDTRLGPTQNLFNALKTLKIESHEIIVWLDGDDCLYGEYAFQILNYFYNNDILLTYGQYIDSFGRTGHCRQYSKEEFSELRKVSWRASHLKSFKMDLFQRYLSLDPNGEYLKDDNGNFYMATSDIAIMFPLMEIAGHEKIQFISNVLYQYRISPHNDHSSKAGRDLQISAEMSIREKKPIISGK